MGTGKDPASGEYIENMDPSRGTVYSLIQTAEKPMLTVQLKPPKKPSPIGVR